jgi:4-oxalocrotonate tautomerase
MTLTEHETANFCYNGSYLGVSRSNDVVFIRITANAGRTSEQKKALFRRVAEILTVSPGVRPEDVFINIVEVDKVNWSF